MALIKVAGHGCGSWRYAHGGGCGHHHGWGGHGGFGGWRGRHHDHHGGWGERFLFSRLETTPGQEKVIRDAFQKVRDTMREARAEWRDTGEISTLLRGEMFDRTAAEGLSGKADASFAKLRVVIVEALAQIHDALDDRQRRILADLIESRGRSGWGGPFRSSNVSDERWV